MREPGADRRLLTGWGRTAPSAAVVAEPADDGAVEALLAAPERSGLIARGLGRSYGDAAQCAGGVVAAMAGFGSIGPVDPASGLVEVGGGVSLQDLMAELVPQGWFVPVTPGTRQVTVGGAVAADVHGKNHHVDGSFARHVTELALATPTGTVTVGPRADPELFWATAGGMGLTGVVLRATVRMIPVETSWVAVDTERLGDLDAVMAAMEATDAQHRYSVAWVDCMTRGRHQGRAVLTQGDHLRAADLPPRLAGRRLEAPGEPRLTVPFTAPGGLLNAASVSAFNELWYRKAPRRQHGAVHQLGSFFHPLDGVAGWNLLYGPAGFVQYQFVVDATQGESVRRAVEAMSASKVPSFLAVLKRFGPGTPGPLSFPSEGWTLALDFPLGPPALRPLLESLDELVVQAGGRVYLAKDARLPRAHLAAMYPRAPELAAVRRRVDPEGRLRSDLSRRLGLDDPDAPPTSTRAVQAAGKEPT